MKKKTKSIQRRIKDSTGVSVKTIYYCAGYKEDGENQRKPYNLTKLLYSIVKTIPKEKRLVLVDNINNDKDNWLYDDKEDDYCGGTQRGVCNTIWECLSDGVLTDSEIGGEILGILGKIMGSAIGGAIGIVKGIFCGIFG